MRRLALRLMLLISLLAVSGGAAATVADIPAPQDILLPGVVVKSIAGVSTTDIQATFFAAANGSTGDHPAILMLPQVSDISPRGVVSADRTPLHPFASQFQAAGINVVTINLDGYSWGGQPPTLVDGMADVQAAYDWLKMQPGVNPTQISVFGSSIGANYALLLMQQNPEVQTGLIFSPAPDYGGLMPDPSAVTNRVLRTYAGTDEVLDPAYLEWLEQIGGVTTPAAGHGAALFNDPALLEQEIQSWVSITSAPAPGTAEADPFAKLFQVANDLCISFIALDVFAAGMVFTTLRRRRRSS